MDYGAEREELAESILTNGDEPELIQGYDVEPSDSASNINVDLFDVGNENELGTVDYNAPNQLLMSRSSTKSQLTQVTQGHTTVNINEPNVITADNTDVNAVLEDGSVGDLTVDEVDVEREDNFLISQELRDRTVQYIWK